MVRINLVDPLARPLISPGYDRGVTEAEMRRQRQAHYAGLASGSKPEADRSG